MLRREFLALAGAGVLSGCLGGVDEPDLPEPVQMDREPWTAAPGMTGLATLSAEVLVLATRAYPVDPTDALSAVSPIDLAVAWGPAARSDARGAVQLSQWDRRYYWRARSSDMKMPGVGRFTRYSGNWHMISASPGVRERMARLAPGDVVAIEGDLVQVTFTNGTYYRSSTSRDDTGDGACEIVRARSLDVIRRMA